MRVFTWEMERDGARRTVVPPTATEPPSIAHLPAEPSSIEWVLEAIIKGLIEGEGPSAISLGLGGTPSPKAGIHDKALVELFRTTREGRIYVTYARGHWQQVHFIGRMPTLDVAKGVRARLVAHGRGLVATRPCTIDAAGDEGVIDGEVVLFALVGVGPLFAQEPSS